MSEVSIYAHEAFPYGLACPGCSHLFREGDLVAETPIVAAPPTWGVPQANEMPGTEGVDASRVGVFSCVNCAEGIEHA